MSYSSNTVKKLTPKKVAKSAWNVINNPFAAGAAPKVPDGSTNISVGQKFQAIRQVECPGGSEQLTLVVFPGLASCVVYHKGGAEAWLLPNNDEHGVYQCPEAGEPDQNFIQPSILQYYTNRIAKWRLVSAGVRFSLINNSDENDGWWECARIQTSTTPGDWGLYSHGDPTNVDVGGLVEDLNVLSNPIRGTYYIGPHIYQKAGREDCFGVDPVKLIEHPSYKTGKLRDIHKYTFNLHTNGKNHDWTRMRDEWSIMTEVRGEGDAGGSGTFAAKASTGSNEDLIDKNLDNNYDALIIRIHGRSSGTATKILIHAVNNQEIVYENGTTLARFHSPGEIANTTAPTQSEDGWTYVGPKGGTRRRLKRRRLKQTWQKRRY